MANGTPEDNLPCQQQMVAYLGDVYDACFDLSADPRLAQDPAIAADSNCNQAAFRTRADTATAQITWLNNNISTEATLVVQGATTRLAAQVTKINDRAEILKTIAFTIASINDFLVLVDQSAAIAAGVMK
jgi:hypothetical protein